jgi:hypothetical protein
VRSVVVVNCQPRGTVLDSSWWDVLISSHWAVSMMTCRPKNIMVQLYRWTCPKLSCDKLYPILSYKNVDPPTIFLCDKL